jgi:hypothetical protein
VVVQRYLAFLRQSGRVPLRASTAPQACRSCALPARARWLQWRTSSIGARLSACLPSCRYVRMLAPELSCTVARTSRLIKASSTRQQVRCSARLQTKQIYNCMCATRVHEHVAERSYPALAQRVGRMATSMHRFFENSHKRDQHCAIGCHFPSGPLTSKRGLRGKRALEPRLIGFISGHDDHPSAVLHMREGAIKPCLSLARQSGALAHPQEPHAHMFNVCRRFVSRGHELLLGRFGRSATPLHPHTAAADASLPTFCCQLVCLRTVGLAIYYHTRKGDMCDMCDCGEFCATHTILL